jgi:hypothetical protein
VVIGLVSFYTFKAYFVRAEGRQAHFYSFLPAVYGLFFIATNYSHKWFKTSFLAVCIACLFVITLNHASNKHNPFSNLLSVDYFKDMFTDVSWKKNLTQQQLEQRKLDANLLTILRKGTVDVVPVEISYIYAHQLSYNPRPVFQSYSAYTPRLDSLNAQKYLSENAPDFVLFSTNTIEGRNPFWDETKTKLALLQHYELLKGFGNPDDTFDEQFYIQENSDIAQALQRNQITSAVAHYQTQGKKEGRKPNAHFFDDLVFQKKALKKTINWQLKKIENTRLGAIWNVPISNNKLLYIRPHVSYSFIGKIVKFLYRSPFLEVEITLENDTKERFKVPVPIANGGVLANYLITSNKDATAFFEKKYESLPKVKFIRFFSEEFFFFRKEIPIQCYEVDVY